MRVVVIGGTGHIGTFLTPRLVEEGHEVISVSRGRREPYAPHPAWAAVRSVRLDRVELERNDAFGASIADLQAEVVVDLTCYTLDSARQLGAALAGRIGHLLHCGTIWVHGPSTTVPTAESAPRHPIGDYGCRKAAIERHLLESAREGRVPATVLHPGHLVGPGWSPVNPVGNFNPRVFADLAAGRELCLPNFGLETLHHVHADDVAQAFVRAVANRSAAIGESFHVVSPAAVTLRGYAEGMAEWFGRPGRLRFAPWDTWRLEQPERDAEVTLDHLRHSSHCGIEKARARLGYAPRYSSLQAVQESVAAMGMTDSSPSQRRHS
jgi:nucleoside-diphosphate-sugar epimerase